MKTYTIKKDSHRSGYCFRPLIGNVSIGFSVLFDDNCKYDLGTIDQLDINKLIGISYGYHHTNSIRIGWRYNTATDKIELLPYIYTDGKRLPIDELPIILSIPTGKMVYGMISQSNNKYKILLYTKDTGHSVCTFSSGDKELNKIGYMLFPYFGGNMKAPHKMNIDMSYEVIRD